MPDMPVSKGGRPRQWSETDVKNIKLQVQRGEEETAAALARNFRFHGGHTLSVDTMERILHKYKYMAYLKGRKPMLSKLNQQKRLQFAKSVAHWTKEQWRRVIFLDESPFPLYPTSGREWFWKHRNEPVRPRQVRPTMQHGGGFVKIWGCLTSEGPGFMANITSDLNQDKYIMTLGNFLGGTIRSYQLLKEEEVIFQQDNAPVHKAKRTEAWIRQQPFKLLSWPP